MQPNDTNQYTEINIVNEPSDSTEIPIPTPETNSLTSNLSATANSITSTLRNTFSGIPLPSFFNNSSSTTTTTAAANGTDVVQEEENIDTLEEPVYKTIGRELYGIGRKTALVLIPKPTSMNELRNWDLWGPFFLCLSICITMSISSSTQSEFIFGGVFVIIWLGSIVVTVNAQLLGGKTSFFQSVCILGYCIFPLVLCSFMFLFFTYWIPRLIFSLLACVWCCFASVVFISGTVPQDRKILAIYPMILFYLLMSYLVMVQ